MMMPTPMALKVYRKMCRRFPEAMVKLRIKGSVKSALKKSDAVGGDFSLFGPDSGYDAAVVIPMTEMPKDLKMGTVLEAQDADGKWQPRRVDAIRIKGGALYELGLVADNTGAI